MRECSNIRLARTGTFETRRETTLELVWRVVEGPLLFEAQVPISGRGKVEKVQGAECFVLLETSTLDCLIIFLPRMHRLGLPLSLLDVFLIYLLGFHIYELL